MPLIGKKISSAINNPLFLIDESLNWNVAKALRLVEYNVTTVYEAFNNRSGVQDPEIIAWCNSNDAVWVHADDSARKEHKKDIVTSGIRFLWVYRPRGMMSSSQFMDHPRRLHYKVSAHGELPRKKIRLETIAL